MNRTKLKSVGSIFVFVLFLFIFSLSPSNVFGEDWTGNVAIFKGYKSLDKSDWEPVETQDELGIQWDFRKDGWPINGVLELLYTEEEKDIPAGKLDVELMEFNIGVRKVLVASPGEGVLPDFLELHPFIGGGLSIMRGEVTLTTGSRVTEDDIGVGIWLDAGCYVTVFEGFNLGFDLQYTEVNLDLIGSKSAGGTHFGITIGFHY